MDMLPGLLSFSAWLDEQGKKVKRIPELPGLLAGALQNAQPGAWVDQKKRNLVNNVSDPGLMLTRLDEDAKRMVKDDRSAFEATRSVMPEVRDAGVREINASGQELGGLLGTFAGVGAKTADVVKLGKAKAMVKAGEDPVKVWQETGWTDQFPDGKWRFEISDKKAKVKPNPADYRQDRLINESVTHPDYFAAYPQLRDMTGTFDLQYAGLPGRGSTQFLEDFPNIEVISGRAERKPITIHEMQHVVQGEEKFAKGGAPEQAFRDPRVYGSAAEGSDVARKMLEDRLADMQRPMRIEDYARVAWQSDNVTKEIADDYKNNYLAALRDIAPQARLSAEESVAKDWYRRLAGEAEARLTQSRMDLTPAERLARPPWLEFDVPREQQIVRGLLGS
ncbi:MAG: hypothetical protein MUC51_07160 [Anaerolineae bacterium]|jgi:hypothetical protein|nr:hypothetical protein [Anaerolineae bacterium]